MLLAQDSHTDDLFSNASSIGMQALFYASLIVMIIIILSFMNVSQTIVFQMGRNIQESSIIYQRESLGRYMLDKPIVMFGGITMIWNGQSWEKIIIYILLKNCIFIL